MNQIFPDHLYSVQHPRVSTLEDRTKEPCEPAEGWVVEKITRAEGNMAPIHGTGGKWVI